MGNASKGAIQTPAAQTRAAQTRAAPTAGATEGKDPDGLNEVLIVGVLATEPDEPRVLPSGVVSVAFSLTVRKEDEKTTSVPLVWLEPPARMHKWVLGDRIVARGSVVRRFYRGGDRVGSSTEVVVTGAHRVSERASVAKLKKSAQSAISQVEVTP